MSIKFPSVTTVLITSVAFFFVNTSAIWLAELTQFILWIVFSSSFCCFINAIRCRIVFSSICLVTTAFLQGNPLQRDIYIQPPPEKDKPGKTWNLLKAWHGLYDASRKWYMAVKETLLDMRMKSVSGDDAFFYYLMDGKLLLSLYSFLDDFLNIFIPL